MSLPGKQQPATDLAANLTHQFIPFLNARLSSQLSWNYKIMIFVWHNIIAPENKADWLKNMSCN